MTDLIRGLWLIVLLCFLSETLIQNNSHFIIMHCVLGILVYINQNQQPTHTAYFVNGLETNNLTNPGDSQQAAERLLECTCWRELCSVSRRGFLRWEGVGWYLSAINSHCPL